MAREIGFDNINMDLIAGLPGEGPAEMQDTLEQVGRAFAGQSDRPFACYQACGPHGPGGAKGSYGHRYW